MQKLHIIEIRAVRKLNFQWKNWYFLLSLYLKVLNQNEKPGTANIFVAKFPYPIFFPHLSNAKENLRILSEAQWR